MTIPDTPQTTESSTRVTRQSAKTSINVLHDESQDSDNGSDSPIINPIMTTSITKWKGLTKPYQHYHLQNTAPDLVLEDRELGFNIFNANNVYEWNIYGKTEYNIMHMLQHMTMVCTAYQTSHESSEEAIANVIMSDF
ncbi:uncharacterized protein DS421_4g118980 [Arachis hypogaea]|nr:uncharacterized protein DS421_4g118980 [Arachis hypogaea]